MGLHEPFNAVSHSLGVVGAIFGLVFLVWQAESTFATVAYSVYGVSLVLVFAASTLYHALPVSPRTRGVLRRIDHSAVFVVIAGTYTPVCLLALPAGWGYSLLGVVWSLTAVGIVTKTVFPALPRWLTVGIYLAMGWTAIVALKPMFAVFSWEGLAWLFAGGIVYTLGALVYGLKWPDPLPDRVGFHGIWHLFVLAGSFSHFVFIAYYVPPL